MSNGLVGTSLGPPFNRRHRHRHRHRRRRFRSSAFCFILLCESGSVGVKVWALGFEMGFK